MITIKTIGTFKKLKSYFGHCSELNKVLPWDKYGRYGCYRLALYTPIDSGKTAESWSYKVEIKDGTTSLSFYNSNIENGVCIATILLYGHVVNGGTWVEGYDYVTPALEPLFAQISKDAWEEVHRK